MAFNGSEGEQVTLNEASAWTENFRETITHGDTLGHFFGKDIINKILDQPGCMGIRIYYGLEENGAKNLVLAGVMANEDDLVNGVLGDRSVPCPHYCGSPNALNS